MGNVIITGSGDAGHGQVAQVCFRKTRFCYSRLLFLPLLFFCFLLYFLLHVKFLMAVNIGNDQKLRPSMN